jgi:hypothetical protein
MKGGCRFRAITFLSVLLHYVTFASPLANLPVLVDPMEDLAVRALSPWATRGGITATDMAHAERHLEGDCRRRPFAWPRCQPSPMLSSITVINGTSVEGGGLVGDYIRRALRTYPHLRPSSNKLVLFVARDSDWPEFPLRERAHAVPSFAPQNNGNFFDILFPTHTRGQFDDNYPKALSSFAAAGAALPWEQRADKAIWRGAVGCALGCGERGDLYFPGNHLPRSEQCRDSKSGWDANSMGRNWGCEVGGSPLWREHERIRLVETSIAAPKTCGLDARFTTLNEHKDFIHRQVGEQVVRSWMGEHIAEQDLAKWRFAVHVGNNGFADRLWRLLAMGLVVFKVENGWKEFYYDLLQPWVHYVPVNGSLADLCDKIEWARQNPTESRKIGAAAARFVQQSLNATEVDRYVAHVLRQYQVQLQRGRSATFVDEVSDESSDPLFPAIFALVLVMGVFCLVRTRRFFCFRPCAMCLAAWPISKRQE